MTQAVAPRALSPVVLVMGKGGVGKTSVSAGLAVLGAESRGRAVFVEFGDGESGRRALAGAHKNVEHLVIKPDEALQRGAAPLFGSAALAKLALGNFAMKPLVRVAPAVRELAMLENVRQIAAERPGVRVVVDMPATGHGVAWLRVPKQGKHFIGAGPLHDFCERIASELVAPGRASIVVVTLPERLVLEETLELCTSVAEETGLDVDRIVVNRLPMALSRAALDEARALAKQQTGAVGDAAARLASVLEAREAASAEGFASLEALAHKRHAVWRLPLAPTDPTARDLAHWLRSEGAE